MPDAELAGLWRKLAHANRYPHDRMVEQEFQFRLVAALGEFKRAADRSSRVLIWLTLVLVVLTAAIVWLTYQLD